MIDSRRVVQGSCASHNNTCQLPLDALALTIRCAAHPHSQSGMHAIAVYPPACHMVLWHCSIKLQKHGVHNGARHMNCCLCHNAVGRQRLPILRSSCLWHNERHPIIAVVTQCTMDISAATREWRECTMDIGSLRMLSAKQFSIHTYSAPNITHKPKHLNDRNMWHAGRATMPASSRPSA
jgi:hypothetical protein